MGRGQQRPSTAPITLFFPKEKDRKGNRSLLTPSQLGSCTEQISSFNHSKNQSLKRQTQVSDRPSQNDRVVSFAKSKRAHLPKKVMLIRARKNRIYIYISTYKEIKCCSTIGLHSVPHSGAKHAGIHLPLHFQCFSQT